MEIKTIDQSGVLAALSALAQGHRLEVFRLLVRAGEAGLTAGHISARLDIPPSSLSFHLNNLVQGDLIVGERDGRSIVYRANFGQMRGVIGYLLENCCADAGQITASLNDTSIKENAS